MPKFAVKLECVSKKYIVHHEKPTLVENILQKKTKEDFYALKDINLIINKGERIGIVGPNGSGKTTLLKIIAGITSPTEGTVETKGKIISLIELSAGFQSDLTGEENIFLNGLLIGMTKSEIRSRMKKIIAFADIGDFIDAPFYTYSSGMALRLGFSIAVHSDPDIIVLDENLAVGDKNFRVKSQKRIEKLSKENKTIIMASHLLFFINSFCQRVISLNKGVIVEIYRNSISKELECL